MGAVQVGVFGECFLGQSSCLPVLPEDEAEHRRELWACHSRAPVLAETWQMGLQTRVSETFVSGGETTCGNGETVATAKDAAPKVGKRWTLG